MLKESLDTPPIFDRDFKRDPFRAEYMSARDSKFGDLHLILEKMEELARKGSVLAIIFVADSMRIGEGYAIDLKGAERWYSVAAKSGSLLGLYGLGLTYYEGKEFAKAFDCFSEAADKNYPPAMNMLGKMYFYGVGIPLDRNMGLAMWRRGANLRHFHSRLSIARVFTEGKCGILNVPLGWLMFFRSVFQAIGLYYSDKYSDSLL